MESGSNELEGQVAIVTGASRNIGRAIAIALGQGGASVLVHANRRKEDAQDTADLVIEAGGRSAVAEGDLTDPTVPARLVDAALDAFGRLDSIVANASIRPEATIENLSYDAWREVMSISLDSVFLLAKASLPSLLESKSGAIVAMGGLSGHTGGLMRPHVVAAKAGVAGLTKALAQDLGEKGITVNCIAPGLIDTTRDFGPAKSSRKNFVGRRGRPEEVAAMVRMLLGPNGRYITGQTIHVNGGALMV